MMLSLWFSRLEGRLSRQPDKLAFLVNRHARLPPRTPQAGGLQEDLKEVGGSVEEENGD